MQGCGSAPPSDTLLWGWDLAGAAVTSLLWTPVSSRQQRFVQRPPCRATTGQLVMTDTGWGMADNTHCLGSAWLCAGWGGMEKVGPGELGYCSTLQEVAAAG